MKKRFKRMKAMLLTMCLLVSILGGINIKPTTASAMTTQTAAVNWIRNQTGKAIDIDGAYGAQCVDLIAAYFDYLGVPWRSMTVTYAKDYTWRSIPSGWQRIQGASIQPGDIVIWTGGTTGHVALAVSGDRIIEQNYNNRKYCVENAMRWSNYWGVIRPNFNPEAPVATEANNPKGCLDNVEGGSNTVRIRGWAFDPDAVSQSIDIHVYIGGPAGVGEGHGGIIANVCREDVNNVYGSGLYHGFDATIRTSLSGTQTVYVYAINVGAGTTNPLIGTKTVDIFQDITAPTISDVQIVDMDATGYTVTCRVEDAEGIAKVQFPTWTAANDQDDLAQNWQDNPSCSGTQDGTTWSFRVNDKDHNFERGIYGTHIYAYDNNGNVACYEVNNIVLQNTYSHVNTASYNGHTYYLYNDILTWEEAREKCEELGGHLVTITSTDEQETVAKLIQGQARRGYWIGGSSDNGGSWVSGEEFSFSNWEPGEPNADGGEDCYGIYTDTGTWNDWLGSNRSLGLGFICEWDEEKVENPDNPNDPNNPTGNGPDEPKETENPIATPVPTEKPGEIELPTTQTPTATPVPTAASAVTQAPTATPVPTETSAVTQAPTVAPVPTATPAVTQAPTVAPVPTAASAVTQEPKATPVPTATPVVEPETTTTPVLTGASTTNMPAIAENLKISSVKCKRNTKKITGKVSVSKATVKIKVGRKVYKRAVVKGKKFKLKLKNKLKKRTKITIKVTKKNYKSLMKCYVVK